MIKKFRCKCEIWRIRTFSTGKPSNLYFISTKIKVWWIKKKNPPPLLNLIRRVKKNIANKTIKTSHYTILFIDNNFLKSLREEKSEMRGPLPMSNKMQLLHIPSLINGMPKHFRLLLHYIAIYPMAHHKYIILKHLSLLYILKLHV